MRGKTKTAVVLAAAALMTVGAAGTAFAATAHWEKEGDDWVYLDSDGDRVTDTWKKNGSYWYYLDSDGYMAKDQIITDDSDNLYYVNVYGTRSANRWVSVDNEGDYECSDQEDVSTLWYYFDSSGKAKKGSDGKRIYTNIPYGANMDQKGTFMFDEDGHVLTGWQEIELSNGNTYVYYLGGEDQGYAATGWQYLETPDFLDEDGDDEPFDDEAWYYFGTNSRMVRNQTKYINGFYYTFGPNGAMDDTWVKGTPGVSESTVNTASDAHAFYTEGIGYRRDGWIYTYDPDDEYQEDEEYWFYLSARGEAFNDDAKDAKDKEAMGVTATDLYTGDTYDNVAAKVIKGKTYLFDENGHVVTGVLKLTGGEAYRSGGSKLKNEGIYYFSTDDGSANGEMETGKTSYDDEGEEIHYYFKKSGEAYVNTLAGGAIYDGEGRRIESEDSSYMLYTTEDDIMEENGKDIAIADGTQVAVNRSGVVKKSGTVEIDGVKYTINKETYEAIEKSED